MKYTLAVTSCNRHDLLKTTLTSFSACVSHSPFETIIFEDGSAPEPEWLRSIPNLGRIRWVNGGSRFGQAYAIDRLYSLVTTELIFWCEDDWEFHESGFLQRCHHILAQNKEVVLVALRSDWNHPLAPDPRGFSIAEPYWGGCWGGYTWNPGLRRLSDYKRFGSYGRHVGYGTHGLGHEAQWSKLHLDAGYRIAALPGHCRHIGGGRSRAIEPVEHAVPKILVAIPACQNFEYGRWESSESPRYSPTHEAYGTDIHISGPNPRIAAIRDTWWNDLRAPVDGRFFYGKPFRGQPAADEVILDCGSDYASLPYRTQAICRWALDRGYQYLFKCDDDTAVYPDRLVREILHTPGLEYGGHCHSNVCTGGPGYVLSRRSMEAVANGGCPSHWAEDCFVAKCIGDRVTPTYLSGHTPGYAAHWIWPKEFDPSVLNEEIVTLHAVQPEMMRVWHSHSKPPRSSGS